MPSPVAAPFVSHRPRPLLLLLVQQCHNLVQIGSDTMNRDARTTGLMPFGLRSLHAACTFDILQTRTLHALLQHCH